MDIVIDLSTILNFLDQPAHEVILGIFFGFGWLPLFILYLYGARIVWLNYIQVKWGGTIKYVFLAIDVPRGNEQSPKAVENVFTYLHGAHMTINVMERWWIGEWQLRHSMEIVSIDGYIQYVIRTPVKYRDLVEAAIYSQYPDAEITEINDYCLAAPTYFPNEEWDLTGVEFTYFRPQAYPIKTYRHFEVQNAGEDEAVFKDPNASLMALLSSLGPGEQIWYQILIQPIGFDWMGIADDEKKKVFGEEIDKNKGILETLVDLFLQLLHDLGEILYQLWGDVKTEEKKKEEKKGKSMIELTPGEKKKIEYMEDKVSKVAFNTKIRFIYLAKKEVFQKGKAFGGFVGYMKQFIDIDLNGLKPDMELTMTRAYYFFVEERRNFRKRNIMRGYRGRDGAIGKLPMIMNVEELATLWHFPLESAVKAPLLQKAPGRKAEAPMSLPVHDRPEEGEKLEFLEEIGSSADRSLNAEEEEKGQAAKGWEEDKEDRRRGAPPENLPFA